MNFSDFLFYLLEYCSIALVPFIVYFVLFKSKDEKSVYANRDVLYFIKYYIARQRMKLFQKKCFPEKLDDLRTNDVLENNVEFPESSVYAHWHHIQGIDQNGNSLSLKFVLGCNQTATVYLFLRLHTGEIYILPETEHVRCTTIAENAWKINGLVIETLEDYLRLRILFNGLLRKVSSKGGDSIEHVQCNFIFNACRSPKFYPKDINPGLLAESAASSKWNDSSWKEFLFDQKGYEQFGGLMGFIRGDSFKDDLVLKLQSCRSKYEGLDDKKVFERKVRIFLVDTERVLIHLELNLFKKGPSQLSYGYVLHENKRIHSIDSADIRLENLAQNRNIPDIFVVHINVRRKTYKAVFHVNTSKISSAVFNEELGFEVFNVPAEVDLNTREARAIVEFWYRHKGHVKSRLRLPLIRPLQDNVPNILVTEIGSEHSKNINVSGGKGNSLALLSSVLPPTEFLVPPGYIITVNAFKRQMSSNTKLKQSISLLYDVCRQRKEGNLEEICKETVRLFSEQMVLPEIEQEIVQKLKEIEEETKKDYDFVGWAVRSSAIGEDSEELSAAGQNATVLGCLNEKEVLNGVLSCWGSLFSYQSVQYRWQHGLPILSDMAVVIQKMVPADSAGVLFTCHPSTLNPSQMLITSNFGVGESVVSGKADPDTFVISRSFNGELTVLQKTKGSKNNVIRMTKTGILEEDQSSNDSNWSITKEQAIQLAKVGDLIETLFGDPRDIEWAFCNEKLYVLQARPITTLRAWTAFELTHEFDTPVLSENDVYSKANVGEVCPNATSALSLSTTIKATDKGIQILSHNDYDPLVVKGIIVSHNHVLIDVLGTVHINVTDEIKVSSKILDLAIFGHPVINDRINSSALATSGRMSVRKQVSTFLDALKLAMGLSKVCKELQSVSDSFHIEINPSDTVREMYNKIDRGLEVCSDIGVYHSTTTVVSVFYQLIAINLLLEGNDELTQDHYADFALILSSCEDIVSAEVPLFLEKIAKMINSQGLGDEFCNVKPEYGVEWLEKNCPEGFKIFKEFLQLHGHRGYSEFEIMEDTWAMNPSKVIPIIQANVQNRENRKKQSKTVDEVIDSLATPKSSITKKIIKFIIFKMRNAVRSREYSKSEWIKSIHKLGIAYRTLANKMVHDGILPSRFLIFHMTHHEIRQLINKRNPMLIIKAVKRQKLFDGWWKLKFPEIIYGFPEPEKDEEDYEFVGNICVGTPVCTGDVTARACVITSLDEIHQLKSGDILITYSTDTGWSPYFPILSGLVTELGGLISHGAVVAREYGLPCIVGVKNATKIFKTGDTVHISGKTGELGKV